MPKSPDVRGGILNQSKLKEITSCNNHGEKNNVKQLLKKRERRKNFKN